MKFDYQKLHADDPQYASMLDTFNYLGFVCDSAVLSLLNNPGEPAFGNEGPEYYKAYVKIAYLFSEETPYWTVSFEDISKG